MWIVFGSGVKTRRVPGGAKVERQCGNCGELATFYEKEVVSTFRLYFVDVFDYQRHRVMACGCCSACYATDELGLPATRTDEADASRTLGEGTVSAAHRVGGYVNRAADALEVGISSLLPEAGPVLRVAKPPLKEEAPDDDEFDVDEDPLEARFRELERKAGVRIKTD